MKAKPRALHEGAFMCGGADEARMEVYIPLTKITMNLPRRSSVLWQVPFISNAYIWIYPHN